MPVRNARVKSHVRTSKSGKIHRVRAHQRAISMGEMLRSSLSNRSVKKITWGSVGAGALTGLFYMLSSVMTAVSALIWAILLACMALVGMLLMTKRQRRAKRRQFRESAALSVERRLRLWTHHKVMRFRRLPVPTEKSDVSGRKRKKKPKRSSYKDEGIIHASTGTDHLYKEDGDFDVRARINLNQPKSYKDLKDCSSCSGRGYRVKSGGHAGGITLETHVSCILCKGLGRI